jgi:hypothetical protein
MFKHYYKKTAIRQPNANNTNDSSILKKDIKKPEMNSGLFYKKQLLMRSYLPVYLAPQNGL